jgi:cobalt-zinc-cadmium resistance protein CzcA
VDSRAAAADHHPEAGIDSVARMRNIIKSYSPVRTVFSEQGRGEDGTDPDGSFVASSSCR